MVLLFVGTLGTLSKPSTLLAKTMREGGGTRREASLIRPYVKHKRQAKLLSTNH